jgi:hypothetical protein
MSTRKKIRVEITTEDLTSITQLREKINQLLSKEKDAKKAAQLLTHWINKIHKTK